MLQQDEPNDLVLATGELCSVRDFAREAFAAVRLSIRFEGSGLSERGIDELTGREVIPVSEKFFRKIDTSCLLGNSCLAEQLIGWRARSAGSDVARKMTAGLLG